ncbi:MAG: Short C-terminal domain [Thermotogaceae bacterium]|jgi:putative membrane protein|nr:Short C-terminal domain [Thermotogaceae bacterium]
MCWFWPIFGNWGWLFVGLIGLALVLFIGYLIYKSLENHNQHVSRGEENKVKDNRAIEILKERLAKGEITEEDYERLRKKLIS